RLCPFRRRPAPLPIFLTPPGVRHSITRYRPGPPAPGVSAPATGTRDPPMTAPTYEKLTPPSTGARVTVDSNGRWQVPDDPVVCLLRGDGIGRDVGGAPGITACAVKVLDAAVAQCYGGKKKIVWFDVHAGDVARELYYPHIKDEQVNTLSEEQQRQL